MLKLLCLTLLLVLAAASSPARGRDLSVARRRFTRDDNESLGEYIKALLNNLKESMPNGIPELNIPPLDPLNVAEFTTSIKEGVADVNLHMKDLKVDGLSGFVVREAQGSLETMTFSLDIFLPEVTGMGHYDMDGKIIIFPLFGKGVSALKVNDLHFQGTATISIEDMKMKLTNFDMHVVFSQLQLYLENIVGGGNLGNMVNTIVNMLGKTIYDKFKDQLLPAVNTIIRDALNEQLEKIEISEIIGYSRPPKSAFSLTPAEESVNTYVDMIMENLRPFLKSNNLDPVSLPQATSSFSKRVLGVRWHGGLSLTGGQLHSLSSIHRVGNFQLQHQGSSVVAEGTVGINRLWGGVQASAWFMSASLSPGVQFSVDSVRVRARISANFEDDSEFVQLEHFGISQLSKINVKITNLGVLGWVLNPLANLVVNLVKGRIIAAIEDPIRKEIIKVLSTVELPRAMQLEN